MQVRIKDIPVEGQDMAVDIPLAKGLTSMEGRLKGWVNLRPVDGGSETSEMIATARAMVEAKSTCSRCLAEFENGFKIDVEMSCIPVTKQEMQEDGRQLSSDELDVHFYENGVLDITRMMEEHVILNIPMQTVCTPDCRGLCPSCGANLNAGPCTCRPVDERFHALRDFMKYTNKSKGVR